MRLAKPQLSVWAACAIGPPKPIWIGRSSKTLAGSDVEPGGAESAHLVGVTVVEEDAGSGVHSCDGGHLAAIVGELVLKAPNSPASGATTTYMAIPEDTKNFRHPEVGDLTLGYQSMTLSGTPGQALIAYYAEPGTSEHDAITLLDRSDADHTSVLDDHVPVQVHRHGSRGMPQYSLDQFRISARRQPY
jgi:hypothetical protein